MHFNTAGVEQTIQHVRTSKGNHMYLIRFAGWIVVLASLQVAVAGDEPIQATPVPIADAALLEHLGIHFIAFDFAVGIDSPGIRYSFETYKGGKLVSETDMRTLHRPKSAGRVQFNLLFSQYSSSGDVLITVKHSHGTTKDLVKYPLSPPVFIPSYMDKMPSNADHWSAALGPALQKPSSETDTDFVPFDANGRLVLAAEPQRGNAIRSAPTISTAARALVLRLEMDSEQPVEK